MHNISPSIRTFFEEFNRASSALDMNAIYAEFAENFMYAGPKGTLMIKREDFGGAIAKQKTFFDSLGLQSTETTPIEEVPIDSFYTLVKAHVHMTFKKSSGEVVDVPQKASYVLSMASDAPVIVLYANPNDLMKLMGDAGLLPAA